MQPVSGCLKPGGCASDYKNSRYTRRYPFLLRRCLCTSCDGVVPIWWYWRRSQHRRYRNNCLFRSYCGSFHCAPVPGYKLHCSIVRLHPNDGWVLAPVCAALPHFLEPPDRALSSCERLWPSRRSLCETSLWWLPDTVWCCRLKLCDIGYPHGIGSIDLKILVQQIRRFR